MNRLCWIRRASTALAITGAALTVSACARGPRAIAEADSKTQSGVYGFSGAKAGDNAPEGVIGECIWIFDQANKSQVAKGECHESDPGQFRITLTPGKYVAHGPGGNRAIEVRYGQWVKIVSIIAHPRRHSKSVNSAELLKFYDEERASG